MEGSRFDRITRSFAESPSRRSLVKSFLGGLLGFAASAPLLDDASATGTSLTIHNRSCSRRLSGRDIYDACHDNGFGCVRFFLQGRTVRTGPSGNASIPVKPGTLLLTQQASVRQRSAAIYAFCSDTRSNRILFDGRSPSGSISLSIHPGEQVVCDWYNITKRSLAIPEQCPGYTRPTTTPKPTTTPQPTTTPRPTTTTTSCPLGGLDEACCPGDICHDDRTICSSGTCVACGGDGQPCCTGADWECDNGFSCQSGTCLERPNICDSPPSCTTDSDCDFEHAFCMYEAVTQTNGLCMCDVGYHWNAKGNACVANSVSGEGPATCEIFYDDDAADPFWCLWQVCQRESFTTSTNFSKHGRCGKEHPTGTAVCTPSRYGLAGGICATENSAWCQSNYPEQPVCVNTGSLYTKECAKVCPAPTTPPPG